MKPRSYGRWAGNVRGRPEHPARCIREVFSSSNHFGCQCSRRRGHGPDGAWCKQHAAAAQAAKDEGRYFHFLNHAAGDES